jgi:hypothetical protein
MKVTEIFTPSDYPAYTYVERDEDRIEERLREALDTPGELVSVSGPSKSGKTVLIEKVAGRENLITVTGAGIANASDIWDRTLDWMGTPTQTTAAGTTTFTATGNGSIKGKAGLPLIGSVSAEGTVGGSAARANASGEMRARAGMAQVIREIGNSAYVLLIDDFHYMPPGIQSEVAKQIKEAARQGVKICTASVPHRSDDVVRSNPELRGRVRAVDTKPWKIQDLMKIGNIGFPTAGINVPFTTLRKFAGEASQSPQLMQAICLQACFTIKLRESKLPVVSRDFTEAEIIQALEETSTRTDFSSLLRSMHAGPKIRGTERKEFELTDGSRGDIYRALLLALKADPPTLSLQWNELSRRVQNTCRPDAPQAASLSTACAQIAKMAKDMYPNQRVIDWEGDPVNLLSIEDPYFLFYLRWSDKLATLNRQ